MAIQGRKAIALLLPALFAAFVAGAAAAEQMTAENALKTALEALEKDEKHEALAAAHHAMLLLTQQDRFHVREAKIVASDPGGYGTYEVREDHAFKPGEKVHVYLEPGAFKYGGPDGRFDFGFTVDFRLAKTDGTILGGKDNFGQFSFKSHKPNTEVYLDLTLTLTGVSPGDYVLKIVVHDAISSETATVDLPIVFVGA